jgi:hypothetical protein
MWGFIDACVSALTNKAGATMWGARRALGGSDDLGDDLEG